MTDITQIRNAAYSAPSYEAKPKGGEVKAASRQNGGGKSAAVELSDTSLSMKNVRDTIEAMPEVRIQKVEEIRELIRNNQYPFETNLSGIADRLAEYNIVA